MLELTDITNSLSVSSLPNQPTNSYPSLGVAVTVIVVPSSYVPPSVETEPPSSEETVKVYWVGVGAGVVSGFGVFSTDWTGVSSSLEQDINVIKNKRKSSLLILLIFRRFFKSSFSSPKCSVFPFCIKTIPLYSYSTSESTFSINYYNHIIKGEVNIIFIIIST